MLKLHSSRRAFLPGIYTHAHLWFPPLFLAVNHHNIENWVPSILTHNLWLIFMGMRQKKIFFLKKKIQNGRLKKRSFFNSVNSQYFFVKISWIGPWVSRIEWFGGHWCGSTYLAVRHMLQNRQFFFFASSPLKLVTN